VAHGEADEQARAAVRRGLSPQPGVGFVCGTHGVQDASVMRPGDVADLQQRLAERGLDWCVVGGWGVDALLRTTTRDHKDLDVLVGLTHVHRVMTLLSEVGFSLAYVWPESRDLSEHRHQLVGTPLPSAFGLEHGDGREVDVHVYDDAEPFAVPASPDSSSCLQHEGMSRPGSSR
jgi:hypothetical protein